MDRNRLRILLTAVILLLAILLGLELSAARQNTPGTATTTPTVATTEPAPSTIATTAPVETTEAPVVTLPPNMLPIG